MEIVATIVLPVAPLISPRVGKGRAVRSGPWRADVIRLARNLIAAAIDMVVTQEL